MLKRHLLILVSLVAIVLLAGCRDDDIIFIPEQVQVSEPTLTSVDGLYLLNEGNMSTNKATLDYYQFSTGTYYRNIFAMANPNVPKEMGDVGNDLGIYGSRLYCVINCSNKVDVLDKRSCRKVGQIDIPNCRDIAFHGGYAYVTSYAGPVVLTTEYKQRGYVAKIDTATLQIVDTCVVGFQPDDIEIVENRIYVANSGGYMYPNYENTLSVIDIDSFEELERVPIAINLEWCRCDSRGVLWVSSRGDYYGTDSRLYAYDTRKQRIVADLDCPVGSLWLDGDSLYVVSNQWSNISMSAEVSYAIVDTRLMQVVSDNFITDGTETSIVKPYAVAVNPITKDIYITDAKSYVVPGRLHCYDRNGVHQWDVLTGDIPGHFAFLGDDISNR